MFAEGECPICTNPIPESERWFKPCPCGFRICIWCFHTIVDVALESETAKCARCPMCRSDYPDRETVLKANPNQQGHGNSNNNNNNNSKHTNNRNKRPPRRSHASKTHLAELVVNDGKNVVIGGLPRELFSIYSTNGTNTNNHNNNNSSSSGNAMPTLQEVLCSHSWFRQYGRIVSCCVSEMNGGMAVLRYFNAEDANNLVKNMSNNPSSVFVASIIQQDKDDDEADGDDHEEEGTKITSQSANVQKTTRGRGRGRQQQGKNQSNNNNNHNTELTLVLSCGSNLAATIVPTRYCSSFLKNEECKKPFCVELHHAVNIKDHNNNSSSGAAATTGPTMNAGDMTVFGTTASMIAMTPTIVNHGDETSVKPAPQPQPAVTSPILRYFTTADSWVNFLLGDMKKNNPKYFATTPSVAIANLQHRLKQCLRNALLAVSRSNINKSSINVNGMPLALPVIPICAKE